MIIAAADLLKRNPQPTEAEIRSALDGNLCRCGSYNRIVRAVMRVAQASGRI
jgi:nicotinate dehydrogenase subunit A